MSKRIDHSAVSSATKKDAVVQVFSLPLWLQGTSYTDIQSIKAAKQRRATFPDIAAKRFSEQDDERIFGFQPEERLRKTIKYLMLQCSRKIFSREPVTAKNLGDCRANKLLLQVHPYGDACPDDRETPPVRKSDIFERVILPHDESDAHYIPLPNGKLFLPLSRYRYSELDELCDKAEKLGAVIESNFKVRPEWKKFTYLNQQAQIANERTAYFSSLKRSFTPQALAHSASVDLDEPCDFHKLMNLLPRKMIEFKFASVDITRPVRSQYNKKLRKEFFSFARDEAIALYKEIIPEDTILRVIKKYNIHHKRPVSLYGSNDFTRFEDSTVGKSDDKDNLVLIDPAFHSYIHQYLDERTHLVEKARIEHEGSPPSVLRQALNKIEDIFADEDNTTYIKIPSFAGRKICIPQLVEFEHRHGIGFLNSPGEHQPAPT